VSNDNPTGPDRDCALCPRLQTFREVQRRRQPTWHNAPVATFGSNDAELLIVGLAPGLSGANRTGRPFTGDFAGDLLYATLLRFGFARGPYAARPDDGLELVRCRITNAVRCVPPENKPTGTEVATCRRFLAGELALRPRVVLALGTVAHGSVLSALKRRAKDFPFAHGRLHDLPGGPILADSYHCSRYNTNTGRLTEAMFHDVFRAVAARLAGLR
jgi:uracil-DNA glycosylase family 4